MGLLGCRALQTVFQICVALLLLTRLAIANVDQASNAHFPKPAALQANVQFWKQVYSEYGMGDFVLHDRNNLAAIYDVVHIESTTNESRAAAAAKPEIQRLRDKYSDILERLAQGVAPDELGPDGSRVAQAWGCPCPPEILRAAAANIRVQQGLRERFQEGLQRARALLPRMLSILKRHNLPGELAALPMVESCFNPRAQSKAGAVGLWQFIRSTGKNYLTITRRRDDRRDPLRATEAAARLLKHNYETLGSWPLAITAYNHGKEGVLTARAAVGSGAIEEIVEHYTGPRFGFASRNFYAEFLAALELIHPILTGHAVPVTAKASQRPSERVSLPARRPAALGTTPSVPPAPSAEAGLIPAAVPPASPQSLPNAEPKAQSPEAATETASPLTVPAEPAPPDQCVAPEIADRSEPATP